MSQPLVVPRYRSDEHAPIAAICAGIIEQDQLDDWLPDPIYYEDVRRTLDAKVSALTGLLQAPNMTPAPLTRLGVPRAGGGTLAVIHIPFDLRVLCHCVVTALAKRCDAPNKPALLRDKVFGFRFQPNAAPGLFTPPGGELDHALSQAIEAGAGTMTIHDVKNFSGSARVGPLLAVLARLGLRADDERGVLVAVLGDDDDALASIDDAFAYLYNFYLKPVDDALGGGAKNFVRYRDEYFTFDPPAGKLVTEGLAALQLSETLIAVDTSVEDDKMKDEARRLGKESKWRDTTATETVASMEEGGLEISCTCQGKNCTDGYEIVYSRVPLRGALESILQQNPSRGQIDGVKLLPALRRLHTARRLDALIPGSTPNVRDEYESVRRMARDGRARLMSFLDSSADSKDQWTTSWAARWLSDAGTLTDGECQRLLGRLAAPGIGDIAKAEIRLLLARSSQAPAQQFWSLPPAGGGYHLRCAGITASLLRRRGVAAPWTEISDALRREEPTMFEVLDPMR